MTIVADQSNVIINAHLLSSSATYRSAGISTYITNLLSHLQPHDKLRYHLFVGPEAPIEGFSLPYTRSRFATQNPLQRIFWEQILQPMWLIRLKADLLHSPAFVGPIMSSCPQVITVHDLSFIRYPHFFKRMNRLYLTLMTGYSCRRAEKVITVSDFTASEVNKLLRVPLERIQTIYHGVDSRFRPLPREDAESFRRRKGLPEKFILFIGTLEPRKNIKQLIHAYAKLHSSDVHLILAGAQGWFYRELYETVEDLSLQTLVHFPGYINKEEQVLWYNAALAFVYLSTYEGFGLPVIEALACGIPTLTTTSSSLPEAAGDAALQAKPDDEEDIVAKLNQLLTDKNLRQILQKKGPLHAQNFTWQATARETTKLYKNILDESKM